MSQSGLTAFVPYKAKFGIRGRALWLAGLGVFSLPCILVVLIWRDIVQISGPALFAIGSAGIAAIATLIGLDLILRPVSLTSLALDRLRTGSGPTELPQNQAGPQGRLMSDVQQLIDELIALRAEQREADLPPRIGDSTELTEAMNASVDPAQAVVVLRLSQGGPLPLGANGDVLTGQIHAEISRRLQTRYGAGLTLAAVGPCDLAFVLPLQHADLASTTDFSQDLEMVIRDLVRPIRCDEIDIMPKLRVGVATWSQGEMPSDTLEQAIAALESAAPAAPLVIFNEELRNLARDRMVLAQELRHAIRNEEFELYYQPIVDIGLNRPVGAEALIRWHSPARGFVAPDVFIPLAEANGLIDPIGLWVLRKACKEAAKWDPALRVAVNLGARQFMDQDLIWHVTEAIEAAGINPGQLEIELTEAAVMADHHHSMHSFAAMRDLGVRIAIEDFGTGQANLSALRKLPFNTLKIDREFVSDVHRNQGSQAICDALIALGAGLNLGVVAAGVEQGEEVNFLSRRGCTRFQGYYFARPVPAHVLADTFDNLRLRDAG